jgi:signal peptidase II
MSDTINRGRAAVWLLLSALIVLADQVSKSYITSHYGEFEFTTVLPILDITRMHNVGAAFSFLATASGWQRWLFIALAVIVSIGIVVWLYRMPRSHGLLACGLALVLGGAIVSDWAPSSTSFIFTGIAHTFRRSTSPIPRSRSAQRA